MIFGKKWKKEPKCGKKSIFMFVLPVWWQNLREQILIYFRNNKLHDFGYKCYKWKYNVDRRNQVTFLLKSFGLWLNIVKLNIARFEWKTILIYLIRYKWNYNSTDTTPVAATTTKEPETTTSVGTTTLEPSTSTLDTTSSEYVTSSEEGYV